MAVHESQSLLIEMQVCRSPAFLGFLAPLLAATFGGDAPACAPDNLLPPAIRVERGLIRVDADEVTYPLHIILRYRLEQAMLEGDLEVADLPGAWNEGMRELFGVVPPDDRMGCLQDIHWSDGAFGYFPCYTLGAHDGGAAVRGGARPMPDLAARSAAAISRRCSAGCAPTSTSRARCSTRGSWSPGPPAARSTPQPFLAHLDAAIWRRGPFSR